MENLDSVLTVGISLAVSAMRISFRGSGVPHGLAVPAGCVMSLGYHIRGTINFCD